MARKTEARGPGRPTNQSPAERQAAVLGDLQTKINQVLAGLVDHPTRSFAALAGRASRAGLEADVFGKGFGAVEAALEDARGAVKRAYAAPTAKPTLTQRINLTE